MEATAKSGFQEEEKKKDRKGTMVGEKGKTHALVSVSFALNYTEAKYVFESRMD